jgi:hypothetical protein
MRDEQPSPMKLAKMQAGPGCQGQSDLIEENSFCMAVLA